MLKFFAQALRHAVPIVHWLFSQDIAGVNDGSFIDVERWGGATLSLWRSP
jgi:hypothetical protein